jgi:hypothetical protein
MYICNAIITHTHSAFSLSILEYINIENLSKEDARKLILDREQYYLDTLKPFPPGRPALLGTRHSPESLAKMSEAKTPLAG